MPQNTAAPPVSVPDFSAVDDPSPAALRIINDRLAQHVTEQSMKLEQHLQTINAMRRTVRTYHEAFCLWFEVAWEHADDIARFKTALTEIRMYADRTGLKTVADMAARALNEEATPAQTDTRQKVTADAGR